MCGDEARARRITCASRWEDWSNDYAKSRGTLSTIQLHSHDKELDAKRNDVILYWSILRRMHHAHSHCMRVSPGQREEREALLDADWLVDLGGITAADAPSRAPEHAL
jgi:hypothetical protein